MSRLENESLYVPIGKKPEKTPYERFAEKYGLPPIREILRAVGLSLAAVAALVLILFITGLRLKAVDAENGVTYRYFGWMFKGEPTNGLMRASDGTVAKVKGGNFHYSDGSVYEGATEKFMRHGEGKLTYADGSVYKGGFVLDVFSGEGTLEHPDGSGYEGSYRDGLYHGKGSLTIRGEGEYVGEFNMGEKEGQGTFYYENGDVFTGTFADDMRQNGVYRWRSGESVEGEFDNNMPSRTVKMIYKDEGGATYRAYYDFLSGRLSEKQRYTPPKPEKEPDDSSENDPDAVG